jgi:hypothetical protein
VPEFTVEVRTAHLPTFRTDSDELTAPSDGVAPWWGTWLKPEVLVRHPFGTWRSAPYGDPGETTWPLVAVVAGVVVLVVLGLAVRGVVALVSK